MNYDFSSHLWPNKRDAFFRDIKLKPLIQGGGDCVATSLAMLTGKRPETFHQKINTQDPLSWSDALQEWGMKLAYCPTDVRRVAFYLDELIVLNDLFLLSYYIANDAEDVLADPDENGWVCGSHVVVMHKNMILNPMRGQKTLAENDLCEHYPTKRIFRVVPATYKRGL